MKIINSILALALLGVIGCAKKEEVKEAVVDANTKATEYTKDREYTEESLSYRNRALYSEDGVAEALPNAEYHKEYAGTSKKIERAFDNAPPMIPHDVEGMLPISTNNNQCTGCHMPEVASSMGATPIPVSHFTNFRPTTKYVNGEMLKEGKTVGIDGELGNTSDIVIAKAKKLDGLYQGRFNCSQCHTPQADIDPLVESTFNGGFRDEAGKSGSNLLDTMNEGVFAD